MSCEGSVTRWLGQLKTGDLEAAQKLWKRYFRRLVGLAYKKLQGIPRMAADEEDVALSAFASFCQGIKQGRFPRLDDRDNLWRLLVTITARKVSKTIRDQRRQKRGGRCRRAAIPSASDSSSTAQSGLDRIAGREPTPVFAAQVADECRLLLEKLEEAELQSIALAKMEGFTNEEIAAQLACAPSTIERRLRLIRRIWEKEGAP